MTQVSRLHGMEAMKSAVTKTLCIVVIVGLGLASTVQQADEYFDELMRSLRNVSDPFILEGVSIPDFNISIASTSITNRKFKAVFNYGKVKGLTDLKRRGHCAPTRWSHGNITFECTLDLSNVFAAYGVIAKGNTFGGRRSQMDVFVRIEQGTAKFVAQSFPNRPPYIKINVIDTLNLRTEVLPDPDLNQSRRNEFANEVQKHTTEDIIRVLTTEVSSALTAAAKDHLLPPV
ncbi:uncharacterized protein LOC111271167 [Varroa jacobsoni]|uniref:uncharacterized protein LOC111271167 n=1 Tax=Varroa jacobsoni TaxID=62625 RepID=UPI000BFA2EE1|nr:uncharacterized protein LOC111271167 [Varroa jacobsoni]XP_022707510.1 uncharacterized protein LOC111271167 [Varroa jacobsoni]